MALNLTNTDKFLLLHALGAPETRDRVVDLLESSGITTLNTLTGATQTFATGTAGTDFVISSSGSAHTFNIPIASAVNTGKLSSTDWSTFSSKQSAGSYITALTGDVSASGPGSASASISNTTVTGKLLTGFVSGAGTVTASDSILTAINKLSAITGGGDVVGPASATNEAVAIYNGTTGKIIKNSAVTITSGQLEVNTAGKGLSIKGGANAKVGLHTLGGTGTDTVLNSSVTANSIIMVTPQVFGGTPVRQPMVDSIVPGVSFNLLYTAADFSTVAYFIIEKT